MTSDRNFPPTGASRFSPDVPVSSTSADNVTSCDDTASVGAVSDFTLDTLVADAQALPAFLASSATEERVALALSVASSTVRQHLSRCSTCSARLELFVAASQEASPTVARLLEAARADVERQATSSPGLWERFVASVLASRARWVAGASTLAVAGALAVVAWPTTEPSSGSVPSVSVPDDVVRAKGTAVRFFVKRGDDVRLGKSGDVFVEGDALRFVVTSGAPSNLLVFGVSSDGEVTAYFPFGGLESRPLDVGAEIPLEGSLILDGSLQTEFLGAVFTPDPLRLDTVKTAVQSVLGAEPASLTLEVLEQLPLPGAVHWVELRKEALRNSLPGAPTETVGAPDDVRGEDGVQR